VRQLPTGTNLSHGDFRVAGGNSIEFCDPSNPQFIPVVAVRSPVTMTVNSDRAPVAGRKNQFTLKLVTATGKAIGPVDLLEAHTRKLHLLIADPTLTDYQHVHPEPGSTHGTWNFTFSPKYAATYRVFADFVPTATARGLYASADVEIGSKPAQVTGSDPASEANAAVAAKANPEELAPFSFDGYRCELTSTSRPIQARQVTDLTFAVTRPDGGSVLLQPVMDAYAHLVAFDVDRSGFAHLHPNEVDLSVRPDAKRPTLTFKVTIPRAGRYVIWAQIGLGGKEYFAPFWFNVSN